MTTMTMAMLVLVTTATMLLMITLERCVSDVFCDPNSNNERGGERLIVRGERERDNYVSCWQPGTVASVGPSSKTVCAGRMCWERDSMWDLRVMELVTVTRSVRGGRPPLCFTHLSILGLAEARRPVLPGVQPSLLW